MKFTEAQPADQLKWRVYLDTCWVNYESVATYSDGSYTNLMKKLGETSVSSVSFNSEIERVADSLSVLPWVAF